MIELIADHISYYISRSTLKKHPNFIVTKMLDMDKKTDPDGLVECIGHERFIFDTTPEVLKNIVKRLRSSESSTYENYIMEKVFNPDKHNISTTIPTCIFSKPENANTTFNDDPLLDFLKSCEKYDNNHNNDNEIFINGIKQPNEISQKKVNVYRSQKIEIDT
jgi:hypothetical protein